MLRLVDLLWGTVVLRPYVFAFLAIYLFLARRDLGRRGALVFLGWGWAVAVVAEYASTRVGIPFGMYHYRGHTAGQELYLSNVPFFDSLSFPFLAYAAWCLARWVLTGGHAAGTATVAPAGLLMMLLDVVIDPAAVRGDRWFLGSMFYYPDGGLYFGVPLSNFAGWVLVGWAIVGGYLLIGERGGTRRGSPAAGVGFYYLILFFNLAITFWIGEWRLLAAGMLVHLGVFLVLWVAVSRRIAGEDSGQLPATASVALDSARRGSGRS